MVDSDGGSFKDSKMDQQFNSKTMNLPAPEPLSPGGPPLPYVLVGDETFQLTDYLLRPYLLVLIIIVVVLLLFHSYTSTSFGDHFSI